VVLINDLTDCPGDGLVIGVGGLTVDLGGHTIDGVGLGAGIRNDGHDNVTITNGVVQEFDYGVLLGAEAAGNVATALTLQLNQVAGLEFSGAGHTARHNNVANNNKGIRLVEATGTRLEYNAVNGSADFGIHLLSGGGHALVGNTLSGAGDATIMLEGSAGNTLTGNAITDSSDSAISLMAASNNNRLEGNTLSGSSDSGLSISESNGNQLLGNIIQQGSDSAVLLQNAHGNTLRGNDLRFNATGIELDTATGNWIEANDVSHSSGTGIEVLDGALGNTLFLNIANDSGAAGIAVEAEVKDDNPAPGNLLDRNTAGGNQSRGISVTKPGHRLVGNVASSNGSWGIYVEPGNSDGGGNVATGNGESGQCYNIRCTAPPPPADTTPPQTSIASGPAATTTSATATFTFTANETGATFECALDGAAFAACASPQSYNQLSPGGHTFAVRAIDAAGNADPTPAGHTWTITPAVDCGLPITLTAAADAWLNQGSKNSNKGADAILRVQGRTGQNMRALVRFTLPAAPAGCVVQSATLRLYAASWKTGRTLQALRVTGSWTEAGVTWANQPATAGPAATTASGSGYRQWNVTTQVQSMIAGGANHGFLIRDAKESGSGPVQQFHSREKSQNTPQLVITYAPGP
jgi:parallel beta-helix repeat protein